MKIFQGIFILLLVSTLALGGCTTPESNARQPVDSLSNTGAINSTTTSADITNKTETPTMTAAKNTSLPRLKGKAKVEMKVNGGIIIIEVDGDNAPITAGNFVDLVERGVYDGVSFHRVVKTPQPFVAQGGDPQSKDPKIPASALGTGGFIDPQTGKPRNIPLEITPKGGKEPVYSKTITQEPVLSHTRGAVAMARSQMPDSASSQFYFALDGLSFLDGEYAVFGYVTQGMDVMDKIKQGDRIQSAKVIEGAQNLQK